MTQAADDSPALPALPAAQPPKSTPTGPTTRRTSARRRPPRGSLRSRRTSSPFAPSCGRPLRCFGSALYCSSCPCEQLQGWENSLSQPPLHAVAASTPRSQRTCVSSWRRSRASSATRPKARALTTRHLPPAPLCVRRRRRITSPPRTPPRLTPSLLPARSLLPLRGADELDAEDPNLDVGELVNAEGEARQSCQARNATRLQLACWHPVASSSVDALSHQHHLRGEPASRQGSAWHGSEALCCVVLLWRRRCWARRT